ncbi:hypothetical protein IFR05_017449 [Cadophora sp. M221]|nr:hypothetical protein IFR05_017449 [Cadophora sp. M221]
MVRPLNTVESRAGPYMNKSVAMAGEEPTVHTDIRISAVFLALYIIGAISNTMIFHINRRRGHKFFMS